MMDKIKKDAYRYAIKNAFLHSGKVRDIYAVGEDKLLIVQTDRLSAFDVVLDDPIPGKGEVLTALSEFWFKKLGHLVRNHTTGIEPESVVSGEAERAQVRGRAMVVRKLTPLTIEAIVRRFKPTRVILFGSQARGDARRDSDVDLLVTFEEVADRRERAIEIASLLRSAPFAKDILVASERDAARPMAGTAMADALRHGLVVYGR